MWGCRRRTRRCGSRKCGNVTWRLTYPPPPSPLDTGKWLNPRGLREVALVRWQAPENREVAERKCGDWTQGTWFGVQRSAFSDQGSASSDQRSVIRGKHATCGRLPPMRKNWPLRPENGPGNRACSWMVSAGGDEKERQRLPEEKRKRDRRGDDPFPFSSVESGGNGWQGKSAGVGLRR